MFKDDIVDASLAEARRTPPIGGYAEMQEHLARGRAVRSRAAHDFFGGLFGRRTVDTPRSSTRAGATAARRA